MDILQNDTTVVNGVPGLPTDAVINDYYINGNDSVDTSSSVNLEFGGMHGYLPHMHEWQSNQAYVKRNLIPIVLSYPLFFDYMPNPTRWKKAYKALIELHPLTIEGFNSGLTVETDEHPIGAGTEMQEEIIDVKRERSTPSFTYKEKAGRAIQKFLDSVIRYGYMDPDVKSPLVTKIGGDDTIFKKNLIYSPKFYTGSAIFIEPDITQKSVVDAWLCVNMFFKGTGDRTGKRDISSGGEMLDLSIEMSAITLNNYPVLNMAQGLLDKLNKTVLNNIPDEVDDYALPIDDLSNDVNSTGIGFTENMAING
jgi:hypothetical protein